jgi:hypothetical protein
MKGQIAKTTSD